MNLEFKNFAKPNWSINENTIEFYLMYDREFDAENKFKFIDYLHQFFAENKLESKGWDRLLTCKSRILATTYTVTFRLNRKKKQCNLK